MMNRETRIAKRVFSSLVEAMALLVLGTSFALALPTQRPLTKSQSDAIAKLADYASAGTGHVAKMLQAHQYTEAIPGFEAFPAIRQLESAYVAAEQASSGSGDLLIAVLSKEIAAKYESVRKDPALIYFLGLKTDEHQQFQFARPPISTKPKQAVTKAIATLADYADGNAIGGPQAVLRDYFGLSPDLTYDILRTSNTTAEAIARGAQWVPESERHQRFSTLVAELDRAYDGSVQSEESLNEFRPRNEARKTTPPVVLAGRRPEDKPPFSMRTPSPGSPPSGGPSTGGGSSPNPPTHQGPSPGRGPSGDPSPGFSSLGITPEHLADEQAGLEHYRNFLPEHYPAPSNSSGIGEAMLQGAVQGIFEAIVEGAGGFGGIVFGNDVSSAPGLGKPLSLAWIQEESSEPLQRGRVVITFHQTYNGVTREVRRTYGPVLLEDAYSAYRIAFSPDGIPGWSKGQGIGLMGLYDKQTYPQCDAQASPKQSAYWRILLNPGLFNSELGQSAVFVDSLPIVRDAFGTLLKSDASPQVEQQIDDWLDETPGTWKFIDRPMVIGSIGQQITVVPTAHNTVHPDTARFIEVKSFDKVNDFDLDTPRPTDEFSRGFEELFPVISSSSHEFSRINGFAPVLALFRWAKTNGATIDGSIPGPTKIATPEAVVIGEDGSLLPASDMTPKEVRERVRTNVDSCLADLSREFSPQQQDILRERQSVLHKASFDMEPAKAAQDQHELLKDQAEYLENVAKSRARRRPDGRPVLRALATAEEAPVDWDDELPALQLKLIRVFYHEALSKYQGLLEQEDEQEEISTTETIRVRKELASVLDEKAFAANLMAASDGSAATQYASLQQAKDHAQQEEKMLRGQLEKLYKPLSDQRESCVHTFSPQLLRSYDAILSPDAMSQFLREHCTAWAATDKLMEPLKEVLATREREAQKADDDSFVLLHKTLPKLGLWREISRAYVQQ